MNDPFLFALTVITILATPGPTNTLLATGSAASGVRRALPLVAAEALGYGISISAVGFALKPLLAHVPVIAAGVRVLVGVYLLWLAWRLFGHDAAIAAANTVITPLRIFVTTLLNPKAFVFALAVVPFDRPDVGRYMAAFMCILVVVSLGWLGVGAALGGWAAQRGRTHWLPRTGACVIALFAAVVLVVGVRGVVEGARPASRLDRGNAQALRFDVGPVPHETA